MYRYVISPHLDDETICLGGSMARWVEEGDTVTIIELFNDSSVCNGKLVESEVRRNELFNALGFLGIIDVHFVFIDNGFEDNSHLASIGEIVGIIENLIVGDSVHVYFPCSTEHQDHDFANRVGKVLMRASAGRSRTFYEYPMPYRAFDNVLHGSYIDISSQIFKKSQALACFVSQMRGTGNMSIDSILGFNKALGSVFGMSALEKVILQRSFE